MENVLLGHDLYSHFRVLVFPHVSAGGVTHNVYIFYIGLFIIFIVLFIIDVLAICGYCYNYNDHRRHHLKSL